MEEVLFEGGLLEEGAEARAFTRLARGLGVFERGDMAALIHDVPSG